MQSDKRELPEDIVLHRFAKKCRRGMAVFTGGLNLDLKYIATGYLTSAMWHANPNRVAVRECFVVFHWTLRKPVYMATVYFGVITKLTRVLGHLHKYHVDSVKSHAVLGINWTKFARARRSFRYFYAILQSDRIPIT